MITPANRCRSVLSVALSALVSTAMHAADWPGWRGVDALGVSPETTLPLEWSKEKNIAWKAAVPGKGASSPIIVSGRVFLTTQAEGDGLHVLAYDAKGGRLLWDTELARGRLKSHDLHNMATPTAVSDGRSVWVVFGTGDYARLDLGGKVIWHRNFVKETGSIKTNHGYGISPLLIDGRLYLALMHQGPSWVMAVDAATGSDVWKKERQFGAEAEAQDSYSSPFVLRGNGAPQLVYAGGEVINAYDPATGNEVWKFGGLKVNHPYGRTIAGPTGGEGTVVVVASGFQNRGYTTAIRAGGRGDITETHKLWTSQKFSADCPTPVIHGSRLYSIRDDGNASCLDLKTGDVLWQERLFSDNVKVSPVVGAGRVYFMSGQGNCTVVADAPKFEVLARNELKEYTVSTPALADGRLYIRTEGGLYCIGK